VGHHHGSSHGPTRVFRVLYADPIYVHMAQRAIPLWRELEDASASALLNMTGCFHVDDRSVLDYERAVLEQCGASCTDLGPDERASRFPWLDPGDAPAVWVDDIGVISADATVTALHAVARDAGATVIEDGNVESIEAGDGVVVHTAFSTFRAHTCVVAAGAWAAPLLATIGIDLDVRVTREQVLYFRADTAAMVPFVHGVPYWIYAVP